MAINFLNNSVFAGNIIASSTSAVIQTPRISMEADGTLDWGQARDYGTLTWDTGYAVMKGQTSKGLYFQVNNNSTVLTLDTSANATFAGRILSTYTGTSTHELINASSNGTVLQLRSTGDNRYLYLQTDHIYSNGNLYIGNSSYQTNFRGSSYNFENGAATFAGTITSSKSVTSGYINEHINTSGNSNAYTSMKWKNDDADFGEIWRNSSTRNAGTGNTISSFNMYNSADINLWSGGTQTLNLTGNNATFAGTVTTGGDLTIEGTGGIFIPEYIYHTGDGNTYFGFPSNNDTIVFATNGSTALTLDAANNATFAGEVLVNGNLETVGTSYLYLSGHVRMNNPGSGAFNLDQYDGSSWNDTLNITSAGAATFSGALTGTTASFNSGTGNVVASFISTDGIAGIKLQDSGGNVELSASSNTFQVQPAGGAAALSVTSTAATFAGTVTSSAGGFRVNYIGSNTVPMIVLEQAPNYGIFYREATPDFIEFKHGGSVKQSFDGNGNVTLSGKGTSVATVASDGGTTLATKSYVDGLVTGVPVYKGTWNASTNSPDLTLPANKILGNYYIVDTPGTSSPNGGTTEPDSWAVGDWCIFSDITPGAGTDLWQRIDNSSVISGAGTGQKLAKWSGASNADSETLTDSSITDTGSAVTIGNPTTITGPLTVNMDADDTVVIKSVGTNASAVFAASGDELYLGGGDSYSVRYPAGNNFALFDNSNPGIAINTSNMNIGSAGPASDLTSFLNIVSTVQGVNPTINVSCDDADEASLILSEESGNQGYGARLYYQGNGNNFFNIQIGDVGTWTNRFTIDRYGDVGVGILAPQGKMTVVGATQTINMDLDANSAIGLSVMGVDSGNFNAFTIGSANSQNNCGVIRFKYNGAGSANNYMGLGFYSNDDILNVRANGNVGIGTTSPGAKLHVEGTGDLVRLVSTNAGSAGVQMDMLQFSASPADDDIMGLINMGGYYSGTNSAYFSSIRTIATDISARKGALTFTTRNGSDFDEAMRIDELGRVTINPYSATNIEAWLIGVDENHSIKFRVGGTNKTYYYSYAGDGIDVGHQFFTGGLVANQVARMGITNDRIFMLNNVGIGTTSPEAKLHVYNGNASIAPNGDGDEFVIENSGNAGMSILTGNTSNGAIFFGDAQDNNVGIIDYDHNINTMSFTTGASKAITINASQKVGIGVTNPNTKLHVAGYVRATSGVYFNSTSTVGFKIQNDFTNNELEIYGGSLVPGITIDNSGHLTLGNYGLSGSGTPVKFLGLDSNSKVVTYTSGGSLPGGPYLPLSAGSSYPLTGDLYIDGSSSQQFHSLIFHRNGSNTDFARVGFSNPAASNSPFLISSAGNGNEMIIEVGVGDDIEFRNNNNSGATSTFASIGSSSYFTGSVGIGTTSPTTTLSVKGTSSGGINVIGVGTTATRCFLGLNSANKGYLFITGSSGENPAVITSQGDSYISTNLGVGTVSPSAKLSVIGDINFGGGNNDGIIEVSGSGDLIFKYKGSDPALTLDGGAVKTIVHNRLDALGIVSINNPSNNESILNIQDDGTNGHIAFENSSEITGIIASDTEVINFRVGDGVSMSDSPVLTLLPSRIGINTTSPNSNVALDIDGRVLIKDSTGVADLYLGNYATANHFRFHTNNANTYFDMNCGDIYWRDGASTRYTFFPSTANMTINGTLTQNSDARVKENIVEISDCISKVQAMKGVYYNRTDFNTEATKVGVIAQDVEAVLPELIIESPEDGLKSVAYSELTAVLINAIKEQQEIIEDLKTRITKLEN